MNSKFSMTCALFAALILGSALLQPFGGDAAARPNGDGNLVGTWRVQVNPTVCQTGAPNPSFSILLSFAQGGTLTEAINSPAFLPGQRSAGLGVWSHTRGRTYKAIWDGFVQFDSPAPGTLKRGVQRLNWDIELDGDQATFESHSQFLDLNGNVLANTCASGTLTRIQIPQDQD
jgi:hypothetical protein